MLKSLSPIDVALIKKIGGNGSSYTLPVASSAQLGGVKPVTKTDAMTQEVGVDEAGALWTEPVSGGGETLIAEETILASGTIAAGEAGDQYFDTGVTVGDLRNWKIFGIHIINVNSGANCSFTFGAGSNARICWVNVSHIAVFEWVTSEKTVLENIGYIATNNDITKTMGNLINGFGLYGIKSASAATMYCLLSMSDITDDTKIFIVTNNSPSVDITWEIRGLIK